MRADSKKVRNATLLRWRIASRSAKRTRSTWRKLQPSRVGESVTPRTLDAGRARRSSAPQAPEQAAAAAGLGRGRRARRDVARRVGGRWGGRGRVVGDGLA